jgi:hypothetical protein
MAPFMYSMFPYSNFYEYFEDMIRDIVSLIGDDQKFGSVRKLGVNYLFINEIKPRIILRNKDPT